MEAAVITQAAKVISEGGVIAFRTDTFYGLGADPFNASAVAKVRGLKGREENKPILLLLADTGIVDRFIADRSAAFDEVAQKFWPGPLTIVGRAVPDLPVEITAGTQTVGVRVPADDDVRELVRACGGALTATSANASGREPARSAKEVRDYFGEAIDLVIDRGEVTATEPSTVLDATTTPMRIVRRGAADLRGLRGLIIDSE
ncbi:MAG TPA: L-threonylcarbamoyladenylate synthase [Pyrinomonadaceae bacterium]|nr:L-threonylcarbamoyladenylate synthase [Pyrinomonadaceae bacterium]